MSVGVDIKNIKIEHKNQQYQLNFFDTTGQELFINRLSSYYKRSDLILLLFREDLMKDAIDLYYHSYMNNRNSSNKLIFVETGVGYENQSELTVSQKRLILDNWKQFDEDYIQIDCNTKYNLDKLKKLIYSYLFDYDNYIVGRERKEIIERMKDFSIMLKKTTNKKINKSCV